MSILVENLSFHYDEVPILKDVSFNADSGSFTSVLGPNGAGKSTLFRCILGLLRNFTGRIEVNGCSIRSLTPSKLAKHVAYIPQSHVPLFNYSVLEIVLMGVTSQLSPFRTPKGKQQEIVEHALDRLGISHLAHRCYHKISGGEQQLVLIARALAQKAPVLIMDEPTANLDFGNQIRVLSCAASLAKEGYTIIQSTHNPDQAFMFSDMVIALKEGAILARGNSSDVLTPSLIRELYGVDVEMASLHEDYTRVCIPSAITYT